MSVIELRKKPSLTTQSIILQCSYCGQYFSYLAGDQIQAKHGQSFQPRVRPFLSRRDLVAAIAQEVTDVLVADRQAGG